MAVQDEIIDAIRAEGKATRERVAGLEQRTRGRGVTQYRDVKARLLKVQADLDAPDDATVERLRGKLAAAKAEIADLQATLDVAEADPEGGA